jgi:hypothetical protein
VCVYDGGIARSTRGVQFTSTLGHAPRLARTMAAATQTPLFATARLGSTFGSRRTALSGVPATVRRSKSARFAPRAVAAPPLPVAAPSPAPLVRIPRAASALEAAEASRSHSRLSDHQTATTSTANPRAHLPTGCTRRTVDSTCLQRRPSAWRTSGRRSRSTAGSGTPYAQCLTSCVTSLSSWASQLARTHSTPGTWLHARAASIYCVGEAGAAQHSGLWPL